MSNNILNISTFSNEDMIYLLNGLYSKIINKVDNEYLNETEINNKISDLLNDVEGRPILCTELPTADIKTDRNYYVLKENKYIAYRYNNDTSEWNIIGGSSEVTVSQLSDDQLNAIIDFIWLDNTVTLDNADNAVTVLDVAKLLYNNTAKINKLLEDKANSKKPVISDSITIKSSLTSMTAANIYAIDGDSETELWIVTNAVFDGSVFSKVNLDKPSYAIRCSKDGIKKYSNTLNNSNIGSVVDFFSSDGWIEIEDKSSGTNVYYLSQTEYDDKVTNGEITTEDHNLYITHD